MTPQRRARQAGAPLRSSLVAVLGGELGCPGLSPTWGTQTGPFGRGTCERCVRNDVARFDHAILERAGEQRVLARRAPSCGGILGAGTADVLPDGVLADRHPPPDRCFRHAL